MRCSYDDAGLGRAEDALVVRSAVGSAGGMPEHQCHAVEMAEKSLYPTELMTDAINNSTNEKFAYRISEFCRAFGIGRTKAFDEIKAGRLKVRKAGRITLIRTEDAKAWLDALPMT